MDLPNIKGEASTLFPPGLKSVHIFTFLDPLHLSQLIVKAIQAVNMGA